MSEKENKRGISSLGIAHPKYDVRQFISCFRNTNAIRFRWIDNLFNPTGDANLIRVFRLQKQKVATVHIISGPGMNNNRTQPHEITHKETHQSLIKKILVGDKTFLGKFRERCKAIRKIVAVAPLNTVTLYVSPWLEHKPVPKKAFDVLVAIIREELPTVAGIITSPYGHEKAVPGYLVERHGFYMGKADFYDLDGTDWELGDEKGFADVLAWARNAEKHNGHCYVWGDGENGMRGSLLANRKKPGSYPWLPPGKRSQFTTSREYRFYEKFVSDRSIDPPSFPYERNTKGLNVKIEMAKDGYRRGFVWKLGEGKNIAVALLPAGPKVTDCYILRGQSKEHATLRGLLHDNSGRYIAWFSRHTSAYDDNIVIVAERGKDPKRTVAYVVPKPAFRHD